MSKRSAIRKLIQKLAGKFANVPIRGRRYGQSIRKQYAGFGELRTGRPGGRLDGVESPQKQYQETTEVPSEWTIVRSDGSRVKKKVTVRGRDHFPAVDEMTGEMHRARPGRRPRRSPQRFGVYLKKGLASTKVPRSKSIEDYFDSEQTTNDLIKVVRKLRDNPAQLRQLKTGRHKKAHPPGHQGFDYLDQVLERSKK